MQRLRFCCANRVLCRLNRLWPMVATSVLLGAGVLTAEEPKPASQPASKPALFPLTEEQVMGPRVLDHLREALEQWSLERHDDKKGKIGLSADMVWIRYACNARDVDAAVREANIANLDAAIPDKQGHGLWMAVRAMRILGGEPSRMPEHYREMMTPEAFAAYIANRDTGAHQLLGMLPLVVSAGDPKYDKVFFDGAAKCRKNYVRTLLHLAINKLPPGASKKHFANGGEGPRMPVKFGSEFGDMDRLYIDLRLSAAIDKEISERIRQRLRAGLPESRRSFLEQQKFLIDRPHHMLAAVHTWGLLQEAVPDLLPSERSYRFDWDKLELYKCAVIRAAFAKHAESAPAEGKQEEKHENQN